MRLTNVACAAIFAMFAGPALADGAILKIITPNDKQRLAGYEQTRKAALEEAKAGAPAELADLNKVLARPTVAFSNKDLTGNWQCRTIKVGKILPLVIYPWFKCRITDDGAGWMLEKVSGSQRTKGRFYDDGEKRAIYLGSDYVSGEKAKPYGSGPKTDSVGYAFRTSAKAFRIEFPKPFYESNLDIIELRR